MIIEELWRYPVKSMQGERLDVATVGMDGLVGDRGFGLRDPATGRALTARRQPELLMATARYLDSGDVTITLPSGDEVPSSDDAVDRCLSSWLGRPVELVRAGVHARFRYDLPVPAEVVDIYGTGRPMDLVLDCGSGLKDVAPIHLVDPDDLGDEDVRRFRPNLVIRGGGAGLTAGTTLSSGDVAFEVTKPTVRCVMVARAQPGLDAAPGLLRRLVATSRARVGVYAMVRRGGSLYAGGLLEVAPSAG